MKKHLLHTLIVSLVFLLPLIVNAKADNLTSTDEATGMEFVFIKGGCFDMGDTFGVGYDDETPVHEVCINDFYIAKYEVTIGEFKKFVSETGYKTDAEKEGWGCTINSDATELINKKGADWKNPGYLQDGNHPVVQVSWNDAVAYIEWLNHRTGKKYRLPTEAEWEYAAKNGGKKQKYSWGNNNKAEDSLNQQHYQKFQILDGDDRYVYTSPVGSFEANELGLYDMTGNVSEWCSDWYGENYYLKSSKHNPQGPSTGDTRVLRGGSCHCEPRFARTSLRLTHAQSYRYYYLGFRLARTS
ncbi:MAG: formylglycine-generating enzyme family protein [Planctomycetota bacterium]|jgi:formylglycine-generating enzyme required for sulfatase activity